MKLTIVGTGYVGLVTGTCFAEMGHTVRCVDVDVRKIEDLKRGILPIYEPGLDAMVLRNHEQGRLLFTATLSEAMDAGVFFIAVGTPPREDGSADVSHVLRVARQLGEHLAGPAIVVTKSTVPVGTGALVQAELESALSARGAAGVTFEIASNPEFLKEGDAVADFMRPDRVIVGCDSEAVRETMRDLYMPFMRNHERILFMSVRAAEMSKYAANAMLATKISFMNEIADLCERVGVDVESVRVGIGSDARIGYSFIYPGCGYGGSCFPKDVKAIVHMAENTGLEPLVLRAVEARNHLQKQWLLRHITDYFGRQLEGRTFALWGLAFKPGTDDVREAPSRVLIEGLLAAGARVRAYDPVAMPTARREFPAEWFQDEALTLASNQYEAIEDADALVLVTEWKPFRYPDFDLMKRSLRSACIFDGRNQYDPQGLAALGFRYFGVGR
ncbi:MAG TPA: UDP-glucose/GDP-mannose dehydrogenase family protein [Acidiferrobacteraceae bacterium]|nr:UDP-glucose/GDP-mannose dehydrogenase family protein [Acidiferrobacteraceae bacterium]